MVLLFFDKKSLNNKNAQLALAGIRAAISKRKYNYAIYHDTEMLDSAEGEQKPIIVFCNSEHRSRILVDELAKKNYHPILVANRIQTDASRRASCVTIDYAQACRRLTASILKASPSPIAFLGFNSDSYPDKRRLGGFLEAADSLGADHLTFENLGDLDDCINSFIECCETYKNVVCANDIAAVALMQRLKSIGKSCLDYNICGFGDSELAKYSSPSLTTVELNYEQAGACAVELFCALEKMKNIRSLELTIDAKIHIRESTPNLLLTSMEPPVPPTRDRGFYSDARVVELDSLDRMLSECDATDLNILRGLLSGKTYELICEENFIAPNTVKYRLKKLISTAAVQNRTELADKIIKYDLKI